MGGLGSVLIAMALAWFCESGTSESSSFSCRALMQSHVWKIVGNPQSPESNWVALGWASLGTNGRSQNALSCGTP